VPLGGEKSPSGNQNQQKGLRKGRIVRFLPPTQANAGRLRQFFCVDSVVLRRLGGAPPNHWGVRVSVANHARKQRRLRQVFTVSYTVGDIPASRLADTGLLEQGLRRGSNTCGSILRTGLC
jgi:hypothetical protein